MPAAAPAGIVAPDVLALRLELLRRSFGYLRPELDDHVFTVEVEFETSFEASSRRKSRADPSSCVKRRDVGCTTALEIVIGACAGWRLETVITDNGSEYRAAALAELAIDQRRIRAGRPHSSALPAACSRIKVSAVSPRSRLSGF